MSRTLQATAVALALAATIGTAPAQAADKLTVVKDAETGQLRAPTAAEAAALKAVEAKQRGTARATPRVGGVETRYADGAVGLTLGDDDQMATVAVKQPDGTIAMECLPARQANAIVNNPKAAASLIKPKQKQKDEAGRDLY